MTAQQLTRIRPTILITLSLLQPGLVNAEGEEERVVELFPRLASADREQREEADRELEALTHSVGKADSSDLRRNVVNTYLKGISDATLPTAARMRLVMNLAWIGSYESIRPLGDLLGKGVDPMLRETARRTLEAIPIPMAVRALRTGLPTAEGEFRIGLIRSLGNRRDSLSVGPLLEFARGDDPRLRKAALEALAEIGDRSGLDAIVGALRDANEGRRDELLPIYVHYAWRLKENQEGGASRRIFLDLLETEGRWRVAALIGMGRSGIPRDVSKVMSFLGHSDKQVHGATLTALEKLQGASKAIAERIQDPSTPEQLRLELKEVLARRQDS